MPAKFRKSHSPCNFLDHRCNACRRYSKIPSSRLAETAWPSAYLPVVAPCFRPPGQSLRLVETCPICPTLVSLTHLLALPIFHHIFLGIRIRPCDLDRVDHLGKRKIDDHHCGFAESGSPVNFAVRYGLLSSSSRGLHPSFANTRSARSRCASYLDALVDSQTIRAGNPSVPRCPGNIRSCVLVAPRSIRIPMPRVIGEFRVLPVRDRPPSADSPSLIIGSLYTFSKSFAVRISIEVPMALSGSNSMAFDRR